MLSCGEGETVPMNCLNSIKCMRASESFKSVGIGLYLTSLPFKNVNVELETHPGLVYFGQACSYLLFLYYSELRLFVLLLLKTRSCAKDRSSRGE